MSQRIFRVIRVPAGLLTAGCLMGLTTAAHAWGDEGHEIVGNVAEHFLHKINEFAAQYSLPTAYVTAASKTAATQLSKVGVRLAQVLNTALAGP